MPHVAVMQFPGPDRVCPSVIAERAGISKQAMNQLLRSLEDSGHLIRGVKPVEGRMRIVRLSKHGHAAYAGIYEIVRGIEQEWIAELGSKDFLVLRKLLVRVWESPLSS